MKREIYIRTHMYIWHLQINSLLLFIDLENYFKLGYLPIPSRLRRVKTLRELKRRVA